MVILKHLCAFALFFLATTLSYAQLPECTLDIGGKSNQSVAVVFQLSEAQKAQMESLRAEYEITYKSIDDEIQKLFDEHPQSTTEELTVLSQKYKVLQAKIVAASRATDAALLATFNQRQYDLYLSLCHEAVRNPIVVTPVIYDESIDKK